MLTQVARLAADATGPSWKDTVAWALWMLTAPFASSWDHRSAATRGGARWMTKEQIHQCLDLAKQHAWFALYPKMRLMSPGEWRLYWLRVDANFNSFYSDQGRSRWMEAAACAARAAAVRQGKSCVEQHAAAVHAAQKVRAMLHQGHAAQQQRQSSRSPVRRTPHEFHTPVGVERRHTRARAHKSPQRQRTGSHTLLLDPPPLEA